MGQLPWPPAVVTELLDALLALKPLLTMRVMGRAARAPVIVAAAMILRIVMVAKPLSGLALCSKPRRT